MEPPTDASLHEGDSSLQSSLQSFATPEPSPLKSASQQPSVESSPIRLSSDQEVSPLQALGDSGPVNRSPGQDTSPEPDKYEDEYLGLTGPHCVFCDMCLHTEPPCCCPYCELPN